uniref:Uncharacterized protein n=1 Tax=Avena sativa TaxID=4498 RepID=A0ACD5TZR3_AVESA
MVDAVGNLAKILEISLKIKAAVGTVKLNRRVCLQTRDRANRLSYILSFLSNTDNRDHPVIRPTLIAFEEILVQALDLVTSCQERTFVSNLFKANDLCKKLDRVNNDISHLLLEANFALLCVPLGTIRFVGPTPQEDGTVAESGSINICVGIHMDAALSSSRFRIFSLSELKCATNNFSANSIIGKPGHATVYKGEFSDGLVVAIKRFDDPETQALVFRVQLQHGNVVHCLGYCHEDSQDMVVEEYTPNGTLSDIIKGLSEQLDWSSAFKIIRGIAEGVAYLHSNCVIHLNLKPTNIVFDPDMNPKICDFETSKILNQDVTEQETPELVGTLGYIPPEYIVDGIISLKSDVFSFGVLLLYIINRMIKAELDKHLIVWAWKVREAQRMNVLFEPLLLDECQLKQLERVMDIGLLCAQEVPTERPTMEHVLEMLKSKHYKENIPTPKIPGFVKNIKTRSEQTD